MKQDSERKCLHKFWLKKVDPRFHYCRLDSSIYGSEMLTSHCSCYSSAAFVFRKHFPPANSAFFPSTAVDLHPSVRIYANCNEWDSLQGSKKSLFSSPFWIWGKLHFFFWLIHCTNTLSLLDLLLFCLGSELTRHVKNVYSCLGYLAMIPLKHIFSQCDYFFTRWHWNF